MKNADEVAIFWDYENCPSPTNTSGYAIVNNIRSIAQNFGSIKLFKAYLEVTEHVPMSRAPLLRSELQSSGVSLTDCPHNGRKDVADKMILVDMLAYAIDNVAPSTIVLISGDRDFAYALSILRFRRYRIVLITLPNAHQSLRAQASISYDWVSEILESVDSTLLNQPVEPTTPRRGKLSSPPAHDKFYSDSTGSSSLFQDSYDEKATVEFMNNFRDGTRCTENSRTPSSSKHDAKHDSLPPYLERHLAASSSSLALNNGPQTNGRIYTPLATIPCHYGSESNFASRTTQTQTRLLQAVQESRIMEPSCHLDVLSENSPLIRESSPLSHQQGPFSPINATRPLSSVDRIAVDHNHHPDSQKSPPANVTAKVTAPTPSLMPPSSTLSSATLSSITQISTNRRQAPPITVPDKFKILIRCLKIHRSKGNCRSLRSELSSEIAQNGTTYQLAGVSTFGEYVVMAEKAGIVELGGSDSNAWITLKAPWYNVTNARLS